MQSTHQQLFFDKQVHMKAWKDSMAGKNEERVIEWLEAMGYQMDKDFVRQHPFANTMVVDIAFVNEQIAIEVDGDSHQSKKQKKKDKIRDTYLAENGWYPIRIYDKDLFGSKGRFYWNLLRETVKERREKYVRGDIFEQDLTVIDSEYYE